MKGRQLFNRIKAESREILPEIAAFAEEYGDTREDLTAFVVEYLDEKFKFKNDLKGRRKELISDLFIRFIVAPLLDVVMDPVKRREAIETVQDLRQ